MDKEIETYQGFEIEYIFELRGDRWSCNVYIMRQGARPTGANATDLPSFSSREEALETAREWAKTWIDEFGR